MRWLAVALSACTFSPHSAGTGSAGDTPDAHTTSPDGGTLVDAPAVAIDAAPHGSITITTHTMGNEDVDLSGDGTLDWAHWGRSSASSFDHLSPTSNQISNLSKTPAFSFSGAPLTASWDNGTPTGNMSHTSTGVGATLVDSAMQFTVAAGSAPHVLQLYAGAQLANASLDVSLSDDSATPASETLSSPASTTNVRYTITFNAASDGQTLIVKWDDTMDFNLQNAFAALMSATLQ